jgi:hypothetical protein
LIMNLPHTLQDEEQVVELIRDQLITMNQNSIQIRSKLSQLNLKVKILPVSETSTQSSGCAYLEVHCGDSESEVVRDEIGAMIVRLDGMIQIPPDQRSDILHANMKLSSLAIVPDPRGFDSVDPQSVLLELPGGSGLGQNEVKTYIYIYLCIDSTKNK